MKKIISLFIVFTMFLQVNSYAVENIFLSPTSSLSKAKLIIENDIYSLLKIDDERYIYIDKSGNTIELFKEEQKWHAKYNGRKCDFDTEFFNEFGIKTSLEKEEQKGNANILGWLIQNSYPLKIKGGIVYFQTPGLLGGMGFGEVNKAKKDRNINDLHTISRNENELINVRIKAIEALVEISKEVSDENFIKIIDFLNEILNSQEEKLKDAVSKVSLKIIEKVKELKKSEESKLKILESAFVIAPLDQLKQQIEKIKIGIKVLEIFETKAKELEESRKIKKSGGFADVDKFTQLKLSEEKKEATVQNPEKIIIGELQKVVDEYKGEDLEEVKIFEEKSQRVLEECKNIYKNSQLYPNYKDRLAIVRVNINRLVSDITNFICSSDLKTHLLGEKLKDTISQLNKKYSPLQPICGSMLIEFDSSSLLLEKCLIEQFVIEPLQKKENLSEYDLITEYQTKENAEIRKTTWQIKLKNKTTQEEKKIATCIFNRKKAGVQLGSIMEIEDENGKKKYYVKTHQRFPISQSNTGKVERTNLEIPPPEVEEMVVYKMLEKLGLGAKRYFLVNPYARSGLFIISEEVVGFEEGEKLEKEDDFRGILALEIEEQKSTPFKITINQFDLLGRIFNLTDFHSGNFGKIMNVPDWKFLDFIFKDAITEPTLNGFLEGNSVFHYKEGGILFNILKNREKSEKIQVGIDALENLKRMRNFHKNLAATTEEILNFLKETIETVDGRRISRAEMLGMNLADEQKKLKDYRKYVESNFEILEQGLAREKDKLATEKAEIMLREFLSTKQLRLSVLREQDVAEEGLGKVGFETRRPSVEGRFKKFVITPRLLQILGRMFSLFGEEYIKEIIIKMTNKKLEEEKIIVVTDLIRKLDILGNVTEQEKLKGLYGMLEIMKLDKIANIFGMQNETEFIAKDMNFNLLKKVVMAA